MPRIVKKRKELGRHYLREWRLFRGLNQEQAAHLIGMDRTNLGRIERYRLPYSQHLLEMAAEVYGCTPSDLLARKPMNAEDVDSFWDSLTPNERKRAKKLIQALRDDEAA